jgi:uncharacterized protein
MKMPKNAQQGPVADLELIDAYLLSDEAPENCMGLSDLDGFLTGLAAGPERILPSEWMPVVWGDSEPDFATLKQADAVLGAIMARYNEIAGYLEDDPDSFDPVFLEGPEGEVVVTDWAAGFMDAVILRGKAWEPILVDEEARMLLLPLMVLGSEDERPLFDEPPLPADEIETLVAEGADIIVESVPAIYEFWKERRA